MRSRYTAYTLGLQDYLLRTWAPETRPATLDLSAAVQWAGLVVQRSREDGEQGWVEFRAMFREGGLWRQLQENSRFRRESGVWLYVDGEAEWRSLRPGRNDPCPCSSGRKFKQCCGR